MEEIIEAVARYFSVKPEALKAKNKKRTVVEVRWVAYYILRKYKFTLEDIADAFGQNHTTVMHGLEQIKGAYFSSLRKRAEYLYKILKEPEKANDILKEVIGNHFKVSSIQMEVIIDQLNQKLNITAK